MHTKLPNFSRIHVLVVGDIMLDRYWYGDTARISPEAPVPVVDVKHCEERLGGAANVALCLRHLGCKVTVCGVVGKDEAGDYLASALSADGVHSELLIDDCVKTTTKLRVVDHQRNQQLLRLDFEDKLNPQKVDIGQLQRAYEKQLSTADVVILSDYAKGVLYDPQLFITPARKAGVSVFVDPKCLDFSAYRGATVLTPNYNEFVAATGVAEHDNELAAKALALIQAHAFEALLITRGAQGMTLVQQGDFAGSSAGGVGSSAAAGTPLHLSAHTRTVYDVTGAGDMVIAMFAASYAAGRAAKGEGDSISFADAAVLANTAGGLVVKKQGTATLSVSELRHALQCQQSSELGILTEEEAVIIVDDARSSGERIVFTNGCFDIVHAGHISCLEQARALGDRLIVAVNNDASVTRLKGRSRPINTLADRMSVLSALRAVDWVVPFGEDTPEHLIKRLLPHVLAKGGDYSSDTIVGADFVKSYGGQVSVLDWIPLCSTTRCVEKIKKTVAV